MSERMRSAGHGVTEQPIMGARCPTHRNTKCSRSFNGTRRTFVARSRPWLVIETTPGPFKPIGSSNDWGGGKMLAHQLAPNVYARLCQTIRPMPKNILLENFQSQATSVRFGANRTSRWLVRMSANDPTRALFAFKRKADVDSVTSVSEAFVNHLDRAAFQGPRFWP
jgi:hypothetical protein